MRFPTARVERGLLWLTALTLVLPARSVAQTSPLARDSVPTDFVELADLRASLTSEIAALQRQLQVLRDSLPAAERYAQTFAQSENVARKDSARLASMPTRSAADEQRLEVAQSYLENVASARATPALIRDRIAATEKELAPKQEYARQIRHRLSELIDPEQRFKRTMSITFAILIGIVIAGFFTLAFRDPELREKVFGGTAGMQFLTLFSLVIAIILFGITGILEGKELSALLGGLSGYILGRSNDRATAQTTGSQQA